MMGGLALALVGMLIMLVAPLHRITFHRRQARTEIATSLKAAYRPVNDGTFADLLDRIP